MPKKAYNNITSRELCLEVILNVLEKGEFLKETLHNTALNNECLDERERAFVTTLVSGTIERKIELDYIIGCYSKVKVQKLKPYIRNILRMAIYQIKYMDKVPDNAAVNEAVKLAVKKGYSGLKGYVNGVLRNVVRTHNDITFPEKEKDEVGYYSVKYSMPEWLVRHFLKEMSGDMMEVCMEYFVSKPELTVRSFDINNAENLFKKIKDAGYEISRGNIFDYVFRLKQSGRVEEIPGYDDGEFVIQDESSMLPAHVAYSYCEKHAGNINKKINILDMCAAPGGKTMHLYSLLGEKAEYTACDISDRKAEKIKKNLERAGICNIDVKVADALKRYEDNISKYDIVIADLPCSGLGVIAKKPDIRYNIKEDDLTSLAAIQADMLDNAACYVNESGIIVYSTCTVDKAENEKNREAFLKRHNDFEMIDITEYIPEKIRKSVTDNKELLITPGLYESDGFFVAVFRKR